MKQVKRRSDCPINFALEIFGDRWSLLVIRDLMFRGKVHYGDFLESEEKIATNILADRLRVLEHAEIIEKTLDTSDKRKETYSLTKKGIDLLPVLIEIIMWSAKYDPKTVAPKQFVESARKNKEKLLKEIRAGLKQNKYYFPD